MVRPRTVKILNREFQVACALNQEAALLAAVDYLDSQMQAMQQEGKVLGFEKLAIMVALNLAYELLDIKNGVASLEQIIDQKLLNNMAGAKNLI